MSLAKERSHFLARLSKKANDQKKIDEYEKLEEKSDYKTGLLEIK